ncbi:MDR/zinc-dependent alcohol dehydrogenase-like family protein [Nitrosomonas marina]|nr:alcohol dehydrogenase catalytic domain-containing protein [Nitrosomonas marina]
MMKGIWLENQHLQFRPDLSIPEPEPEEALIRVISAGICNTDLELVRGYYPYSGVLGHEFVGIVENGADELDGKRVVGEINAACGRCRFCNTQQPTHCENRTVLGIVNRNGAFADYTVLPVENLHPVPDTVSTDTAVFTEPVAAALEIQQQVRITPNDRVLVVGDGKLGLLVAQTLALTGCELVAAGRHADKLAILQDQGITTTLAETVERRSFDLAVECTGNPVGFDLARRALRARGTLVLKSTYAGELNINASALVVDEITVIGSRCGPFNRALAVLAAGSIQVEPLIHGRYQLEQGIDAFNHARTRGTLKILFEN